MTPGTRGHYSDNLDFLVKWGRSVVSAPVDPPSGHHHTLAQALDFFPIKPFTAGHLLNQSVDNSISFDRLVNLMTGTGTFHIFFYFPRVSGHGDRE